MGRRSLDATNVLCKRMVRAAVAFLRGVCPFLDDGFFWPAVSDVALLFLLHGDALFGFFLGGVAESWAGNPLPCSNSNAARLVAVNRLRILTGFSVTRLQPAAVARWRCTLRFPLATSDRERRTCFKM